MRSRFNSILAIGGALGLVAIVSYGTFFISGLLTFLFSIGSAINIAFYELTGNFLIAHLWIASSYATVALVFFYATLIVVNVQMIISRPIGVVVSIPLSLFGYIVVTGSVELLNTYIATGTEVGLFTRDFLTGVIYSSVGASTLTDLLDENEEEDEEDN